MIWNVFFILMCLCAAASFAAAAIFGGREKGEIFKPFNMLCIGIIVTAFVGIFPTNYNEISYSANFILTTVEATLLSLVNVMQIFTADMDGKELLDVIGQHSFFFDEAYIFIMSVICTIAPFLTVSAIVSAFMSFSAGGKYLLGFFRDKYIFSDMNERSMTLAESIYNDYKPADHSSDSGSAPHGRRPLIVFTDVVDREGERYLDLSARARRIGAILYKADIVEPNFGFRRLRKAVPVTADDQGAAPPKTKQLPSIRFFIMGEDDTENLEQTLRLIERYGKLENTYLDLFSSNRESELALTNTGDISMKVKRIDEVRTLIYQTLYTRGELLFDTAVEIPDNEMPDGKRKHINVVIVGLGRHGTEMLKALTWYCQMCGYLLTIDAFDIRPDAESKIKAACPTLLTSENNGVKKPWECYYNIRIHSGMDIDLSETQELLTDLGNVSYIFTAPGSDIENVRVSVNLRTLYKRLGYEPIIQTIVSSSDIARSIKGAVDLKKAPYNIDCIGDMESTYSKDSIIPSKLETSGLGVHLQYSKQEKDFWGYEYNYRSSTATVMHKEARDRWQEKTGRTFADFFPGIEKLPKKEQDKNFTDRGESCLEHMRWIAYVRTEGYIYGDKRDDIAKTHEKLLPYDKLPDDTESTADDAQQSETDT